MAFDAFGAADIAEALQFIDASCSRQDWITTGMAIKSEFPGADGFSLFDDWSATGEGYDKKGTESAWRSIKSSGAKGTRTLGSVVKLAMDNGWRPNEYNEEQKKKFEAEKAERLKKVEAQRIQSEKVRRALYEEVARCSQEIWFNHLQEEGRSEYLEKKQVRGFGIRFVRNAFMYWVDEETQKARVITDRAEINQVFAARRSDSLGDGVSFLHIKSGSIVVPVVNADGVIRMLQVISSTGTKMFLKHGEKKGNYFFVGQGDLGGDDPICIAEGYATAASIHMATGWWVAVCWDCGNMESVTRQLQALYPGHLLLLCADDDAKDEEDKGSEKKRAAGDDDKNSGLDAARAAAQAVGGRVCVAVPKMPEAEEAEAANGEAA